MKQRYAIEDREHPIYKPLGATMTAKHSPATSLPWPGLIPEPNFAPQDAVYIVHAANAYPKLVEALFHLLEFGNSEMPDIRGAARVNARDLLRELGEAE